jgi:hypothetical protein
MLLWQKLLVPVVSDLADVDVASTHREIVVTDVMLS